MRLIMKLSKHNNANRSNKDKNQDINNSNNKLL